MELTEASQEVEVLHLMLELWRDRWVTQIYKRQEDEDDHECERSRRKFLVGDEGDP